MKPLKTLSFVGVVLLATAQLAIAESHAVSQLREGRQRAEIGDLKTARESLVRRAQGTKGSHESLLQEQRRIDHLIDDLEHGRSVDPSEIDRALENAERSGR